MSNKQYISLPIVALSLSLVTCGSTPQSRPQKRSYYEGNGGKGISIAILAPKATGLSKEQEYIPSLIQGELVSNFTGYSAIAVLDRQRLDEQYAELLSGYYDDNSQAGTDLGHLNPTGFLMTGNLTKTAAGYAMQISITNNTDKMTAASYSGTFTFAELDNLSGVRQASLDLLQKMGVILTEPARTELGRAAADNHVNAQTALAQGITAQQGGTVVAALSYYYQAAVFDPSLLEASKRAGVMSTAISRGNIGTDVRNDIQRRKEWLKILDEAEAFLKNHLPIVPQKGYRQYTNSDVFRLIRNDVISTASETETVTFKNVNANDITDNLTVKIISVNGISAEEAGRTGYIRITNRVKHI